MISRLTGALIRAGLVMVLLATPSILLPDVGPDGKQLVALAGLFGGVLTFVEYKAAYPGLVEFRDAPPFNRIRFLMLFAVVSVLTLILRGGIEPTPMTQLFAELGVLLGHAADFPYSPVRLATLMLSANATSEEVDAVRITAASAYTISLAFLTLFILVIRLNRWPSRNAAFNVWINLPTFEATAGGDVVQRLVRDARFNVALGFLLPFLIPTVVRIGSSGLDPQTLASPQTLVWAMTAWAFLPASLFMRGVGMARIAEMIREKRRLGDVVGNPGLVPA